MKSIKRFCLFIKKAGHFGVQIAFWDIFNSLCCRIGINQGSVNDKKHAAIFSWLTKNYSYLLSEYNEKHPETYSITSAITKYIWICWWDGIENMPEIVKSCYKSIMKYSNGFQVILITKENYINFISIPEHIIAKFKSGKITVTHLSDIIRMALLARHGGLWLDATILATDYINFADMHFFTIKRDYCGKFVSKQRWSGNCIAGSQEILLFKFLSDFFSEYWKNQDTMIDYFLIDYAIAFAYENIFTIKSLIDCTIPSNKNYMLFNRHLNDEFSKQFYDEATKDTFFHKLTWKKNYPVYNSKKKLTLYGYIIQQYID